MTRGFPATNRTRLDPRARRRKYHWSIIRSVLAIGVMVVIGVSMAMSNRLPRVLDVVPATALYDDYRPVGATDVFHPDDVFFVSVRLRGFRIEMDLAARWLYQDQVIAETALDADNIDRGDGQGGGEDIVGFLLRNDNPPWPVGRYTVEIIHNNQVLGSASFRVEP
ncbi:MAG: hypothetical protein JXB07_07485 [Anaerolineae bacterium]|nr:hypothetical protein [Anaerolineae bacterium]